MRSFFLLCIAFLLVSLLTFAEKKLPINKEQVLELISEQKQLGFQENKGQIADMDGKPAPYVLFKAEVPNLNIWVTTTGLTYQFFKEEEKEKYKRGNSPITQDQVSKKENLEWHRVDMVLKASSIKKENIITEGNITQGDVSYYLGLCPNGIFNVKTYTKITIKEVYPGIDWILYTSSKGTIKHDFIVHPKADPNQIKLIYEGSGKFQAKNNEISFENKLGTLTEGDLLCYQGNESNTLKSNYIIKENQSPLYLSVGNLPLSGKISSFHSLDDRMNKEASIFSYEVGIALSNYDNTLPLIIDPQLVWGTLYGGNSYEQPLSMDCDASGNVYVTGYCSAANFPTQTWGGAYFDGTFGGAPSITSDIFILRFTNTGVLTWATYYGGSGEDYGHHITTDAAGNIYVTGWTNSNDFPIQSGIGTFTGAYFDGTFGGGTTDVFILRFTNTGVLTWATYYGGDDLENGYSITTDAAGNIYVTGWTRSANFHTQNGIGSFAGAYFDGIYGGGLDDIFILRFSNTGVLEWATYYGGSLGEEGFSIAVDVTGNTYITGWTYSTDFPTQPGTGTFTGAYFDGTFGTGAGLDIFILRFSNTGVLEWATYYGGSSTDEPCEITTDAIGNVYVTGDTKSSDFNVQAGTLDFTGAYFDGTFGGGGKSDIFILRFNNTGVLTWATYYGGNDWDYSYKSQYTTDNIEIDNCGNIYVSLCTFSADIQTSNPGCSSYFHSTKNGFDDLFLIKFSSVGSLLWASYIGLTNNLGWAIAVDMNNGIFIGGQTQPPMPILGFPAINPGGGAYFDTIPQDVHDCFIAKFIPDPPAYTISQVNATGCNSCDGSATISITCGNPDYSYSWSNGNQLLNSASNINTVTGLCPGNYTVIITSNCNQTQVITFTIIGGSENLTVLVNSTEANCGLNDGTATAYPSGGIGNYQYYWSTGGTTSTISNLTAGIVTVTVTDANGCQAMNTINVIAGTMLTAFASGSTTILSGSGTILSAGGGIYYQWNPTTGLNCNTCKNPFASPEQTIVYCVTVSDDNGCSDSACVTVSIDANCEELFIPTAFSPNENKSNDAFCVYSLSLNCIESYIINIYDRWGQKVYSSSDYADCWDGKYNGKSLCTAMFVYDLRVIFTNHKKFTKRGNITLIK